VGVGLLVANMTNQRHGQAQANYFAADFRIPVNLENN